MIKKFFRERLETGQHNIKLEWRSLKEFGFVPASIILLGVVISSLVSLPAVFGTLTIVMGNNPLPSPTESIGLALLSAALAGVVLLLVKPQLGSADGNSSGGVVSRGRPAAEIVGGSFIVAAIALTLFAVLCPFLGATLEGQRFFPHTAFGDFSEVCVKWTALVSLLIGTITFVIPLTLGPFLFVSGWLQKRKWGRVPKLNKE